MTGLIRNLMITKLMIFQLYHFSSSLFIFDDKDIDIIIPPLVNDTSLPERLLVFIPGGKVPNTNYALTSRTIQKVASELRLWIVIVAVPLRLCAPICGSPESCSILHQIIENAIKKAITSGCHVHSPNETFIVGHSLGGACIVNLLQGYQNETYAAAVLMGSYVNEQGKGSLYNFPVPILTLGGELDGGGARPGKLALWFQQFLNISKSISNSSSSQMNSVYKYKPDILAKIPVIILPKIDHSDFCSGFFVPGDLPSEASQDLAMKEISETVVPFLYLHSGSSIKNTTKEAAFLTINRKVNATELMLTAVLQTLQMEGGVNTIISSGDWIHSSWCKKAQQVISELNRTEINYLTINDTYHKSELDVVGDKNSFADCHQNYTAFDGGKENKTNLNIYVCSHNHYLSERSWNVSLICANEVGCKMISGERIAQQLQKSRSKSPITCKEINMDAVEIATTLLSKYNPQSYNRYITKGRKFCFKEDIQVKNEQKFINTRLGLVATNNCLQVTSVKAYTTLDDIINPGLYSCKLLSPARALDWIMTDSLRQSSTANDIILKPNSTSGRRVAFIFVGRKDVLPESYIPLCETFQTSMAPDLSVYVNIRLSLDNINDTIKEFITDFKVQDFFFVGHSMENGGSVVQNYIRNIPSQAKAIILLAGFLQRSQRPDIRDCLLKTQYQPKVTPEYPKGYLKDGLHDCFGPNVIDYPVPSLTIGGELDGVVRITRIAEAFYTQQVLENRKDHPVVVIQGMNHAQLLNISGNFPYAITSRDLRAEIEERIAIKAINENIRSFIMTLLDIPDHKTDGIIAKQIKITNNFFTPLLSAFVDQEASWFFTGGDDEHASTPWSAQAQIQMASPLPPDKQYSWTTANSNHLLSDEKKIPPYYRQKHRPEINVTGTDISASTVCQPRYIKLTVQEAGMGENGTAIIEEEKLNILTALNDTGFHPVSAIELATKLASRQLVFNRTNHDSPVSLDDGNRCGDINQKAYAWAIDTVNNVTRKRFQQYGIPLTMGKDIKPFPPAGPWWIWNYLQYTTKKDKVEVSAYYAFYSLSSDPYGAGNHYCKLLSPARAMEWIMVDGLRENYHI